jgi:hypothetical protein
MDLQRINPSYPAITGGAQHCSKSTAAKLLLRFLVGIC